jgi:N-acetylglucosamine kinase-like BadF-type ATPase
MNYFLAIDAGGTKTVCALADETQELARVRTGTIKLLRVGPKEAGSNLAAGLAELSAISGVELRSVTRTCIGSSGASVPLVSDWIRQVVAHAVGGELLLCGDEEIALDAAFRGGRGVLALAGTGSNVAGRTHDGRLISAGGWGPSLGDDGSGFWIGREGLRRAFRAIDERRPSVLIDHIRNYWQLEKFTDVVQEANATPPPDFSLLAETVAACAATGDEVALEVLQDGGKELARLALLVIERIRELEGEWFALPAVAIAGSVLSSISPVRKAMVDAMLRVHPSVRILAEGVDPVLGALWRARKGAGITSPR